MAITAPNKAWQSDVMFGQQCAAPTSLQLDTETARKFATLHSRKPICLIKNKK
jgi:hypothetical protein